MAYTTINKGESHFNAVLTTGTGNSQAVTGVGFQPDWIWGKRRDSTGKPSLFDSVRGVTKGLESSETGAEFTSTDYYSSFDTDGFTIGAGAGGAGNGSSQTAVQWCWKAGGSASSNTDGQLTSSVSVNQDAGFSVLTYTGVGDGTSGTARTVGHGLGVTPAVLIIKNRADSTNWNVYHHKNTSAPETEIIYLNLTNATADDNGFWNDTAPTSSVFTVGGDNGTNGNGDSMIAYCFAEKQGYSKFGTYIGNGNVDGTFIYLGFKPAWFMIKSSSNAEQWEIVDNVRDPFNPVNQVLVANSDAEETTGGTGNRIYCDFLSNGVKLRGNASQANGSGLTFVYMAFAEMPFVNSNGVPGTAR